MCPGCTTGPRKPGEQPVHVDGVVVEAVNSFCYLGDVMSCEGGVERSVSARFASAWRKWKDITGLLTNRHVPLKNRGSVYNACISPPVLYGA